MKSKYLLISAITFLIGLTVTFAYLFSLRSLQLIAQNPVSLEVTLENQGRRCEDEHWDDPSENQLCYRLQEQLGTAIYENNIEGIKEALKFGANVNGSYYQSDEPLIGAAMLGKKEVVLILLENGANVNETGKWKINALQKAIIYHHKDVVEVLLENGTDLCHKADWDDSEHPNPTALDIAHKYENDEIVDLLNDFGARRCF